MLREDYKQIAELSLTGLNAKEIAKETGFSTSKIYKALKDGEVVKYTEHARKGDASQFGDMLIRSQLKALMTLDRAMDDYPNNPELAVKASGEILKHAKTDTLEVKTTHKLEIDQDLANSIGNYSKMMIRMHKDGDAWSKDER